MPERKRKDLQKELNPSHYFELFDRTHIASSHVQMALGDHPVLKQHPELAAHYDRAVDEIERLYQALGGMDQTWL